MEQILTEIAKQTPAFGVLVFFIWYFMRVVDKKEKRIDELSKFILDEQKEFTQSQRDDQRELLEVVSQVTKALNDIKHYLKYEKRE